MKIATFNVNGVNGRLPVLFRWLAEDKPDVACLQELKVKERFLEAAIRKAGYGAIWTARRAGTESPFSHAVSIRLRIVVAAGRSGRRPQPVHRGADMGRELYMASCAPNISQNVRSKKCCT